MKGRIVSTAAELTVLRQPAVAPATALADYIAALARCTLAEKEKVSLRLFERWGTSLAQPQDLSQGEALIARFSDDIEHGRIAGKRGKYRSMMRQAPGAIYALHNRAVTKGEAGFHRALLPRKTVQRLSRLAGLTPATQTALAWFLEKGMMPAGKGKAAKPLTAKSRRSSYYAALQLLEALHLAGLELVTRELVPELSPDDPNFKTMSRILHTASAVYRACVGRGLLTVNPLTDVGHSIFDNDAVRDFLAPAELAKLLDLGTVDLKNARQVTDRLVCLLYVDSAVRRDELAGVTLADVRERDDGYQIVLQPEVQKMQGKAVAILDLLYAQTNQLLGHYLRHYRGKKEGALILNTEGRNAKGAWLAKAVKRETSRLGIRTYYDNIPSPHCLRRTFATCNCKPLGLCMDVSEIAVRLRIDVKIAHRHYIQQNPLLSEMKTKVYRQAAAPDPLAEAGQLVEGLARLGFPAAVLKPVCLELERRKAKLVAAPVPHVEWVDESAVLARLRQRWNTTPNTRKLRAVFAAQGYTDRGLAHGRIRYRLDAVDKLLTEYSPAHLFAEFVPSAKLKAALLDFVTLQVGGIVLLRNADISSFMQRIHACRGNAQATVGHQQASRPRHQNQASWSA